MTTIVSIFTIIAAISTVIYTIITIRTLREIRKQRETTYMPNVILGDSSFTMNIEENLDHQTITFEENENSEKTKDCYLNIYNIGLASAKDISLQFEFDNDTFIKLLEDNIPDLKVEILPNGFLGMDYKNIKYAFNIDAQCFSSKDFLLPVNINSSSIKLNVPPYIIYILFFLIYKIEDNYDLLSSLPDFKLEMKYHDIYDKQIIQSHRLNFNIFGMTKTDVIFEIIKK